MTPERCRAGPSGRGRASPGLRLSGVLVVLIAGSLYVHRGADAPFAGGMDRDSALRAVAFTQGWQERGFGESLGVPFATYGEKALVDRSPYLHHPATGWWFFAAGISWADSKRFGLRMVPCLLSAAASLLLYLIIERRAGPLAGVLGAVLFLALPVMQEYGVMPAIELPLLPASLAFVGVWMWWRARPSPVRTRLFHIAFLLGCLLDWEFCLLAPGIWLAEAVDRRGGLLKALRLLPLGIAGFVLVTLLLGLATGSLGHVFWTLVSAAGDAQGGGGAPFADAEVGMGFLDAQARWCRMNIGLLWGLAAFLALVVVVRRPAGPSNLAVPGLPLLVQGVLTLLLFRQRSATHGYFWYFLAAPAVLFPLEGAARTGRWLAARWRPRARFLPMGVLVLLVLPGAAEGWQRRAPRAADDGLRRLACSVDRLFGPTAMILTPDGDLLGAALYSSCRFMAVFGEDQIAQVLRARAAGEIPDRRVVALATKAFRTKDPVRFGYLMAEAARRGVQAATLGPVIFYDFGTGERVPLAAGERR